MRTVIQRVNKASVTVAGELVGSINKGLLVFLGIATGDDEKKVDWMANKIVNMRIFPDEEGKMNLSAIDCGHEILVISQFTLLADCRKGNRPNFMDAASPAEAERLYEMFISKTAEFLEIRKGVFGAMMDIEAHNDGPVTIVLDA